MTIMRCPKSEDKRADQTRFLGRSFECSQTRKTLTAILVFGRNEHISVQNTLCLGSKIAADSRELDKCCS